MMDKKLVNKDLIGKKSGGKQGNKFDWRFILGAIAFCSGAFAGIVSILESPVQAATTINPVTALEANRDNFNDSLKLAQVGISSPSNAPIPLNLRPRIHIPLPTDSRSRDDHYHSGYDYGYEHGYDHGYEDGYYRGKHRDYPSGRLRDRHRKETVIIINPATSSTYESYGNYGNYERDNHQRGYIRIIRNKVSF